MRPASTNIRWHASTVSREDRPTQGATIWMTGLPASGKSTLARALEARLVGDRRPAYVLDGDNLRHGLTADLGFDRASRDENVRRAAEAARLLADAGVVAIVSLISPFAGARAEARRIHEADGLPFVEVWVSTPVEECERRDPKGLYAKARRGELTGLTGVDDPYEAPEAPDVEARPGDRSTEEEVQRVLDALAERSRAAAGG